jgi:hypothetical protein
VSCRGSVPSQSMGNRTAIRRNVAERDRQERNLGSNDA